MDDFEEIAPERIGLRDITPEDWKLLEHRAIQPLLSSAFAEEGSIDFDPIWDNVQGDVFQLFPKVSSVPCQRQAMSLLTVCVSYTPRLQKISYFSALGTWRNSELLSKDISHRLLAMWPMV
jgi:hypothetical protein